MKTYIFGTGKRLENLINNNVIDISNIDGFFDNDSSLWSCNKYDLSIEKPYYDKDIDIYLAVNGKNKKNILMQLIVLGYRKIKHYDDNVGTIIEYDYSKYGQYTRGSKLIVLYFQHASYSNIIAIDYMIKNKLVDVHGMQVELIDENNPDVDDYYKLAMADYIVTERDWDFSIETKAKICQLWHGFPFKAMINMETDIDDDFADDVSKRWNKFDVIFSYGRNYSSFMCACYGTKVSRFVEIGMPRNDLLFCVDGKEKLNELFPASVGKKIVLYMPTFRESDLVQNDGSTDGYFFYWEGFDVESFDQYCKENDIFFIFKLHPSDISKISTWNVSSENMGVMNDKSMGENCTYHYLNGADVLITDYSSVYFDFLLLDRPIIFTNADEEQYRARRGIVLDPVDFWRPGDVVSDWNSLKESIVRTLQSEDTYSDARKQLIPFVYKYADGNTTQRMFDYFRGNS